MIVCVFFFVCFIFFNIQVIFDMKNNALFIFFDNCCIFQPFLIDTLDQTLLQQFCIIFFLICFGAWVKHLINIIPTTKKLGAFFF